MAGTKFNLDGKVALVTGGNGGIGLGMARALAEAGADVCIWGRNEEKNKAAEEELKLYGKRVLVLKCDVAEESQVEECFAKTVETMGRVDSCFANAGIAGRGTKFHEMTLDEWRMVFRVNMEGVFFTFRSAVSHMLERGDGGSLVVTSSGTALMGPPRSEHYAATKAGVIALARSIAVEYARNGIRANAIIPGWIETDMTEVRLKWDRFRDAVLPRIPQRRWGVPDDFGPIAVYFASDASAYHTGDAVVIDGGFRLF
ncbi:MAG: SDR family oxidoreductase [Deltaproteobacteria bacterium]|nr:SDR family oxidoreductase [Deltaproteobacteria bacterium]